jgi:hypothetical protein
MIISASRRTDIPSYYSDWFFHRLEAGFVYTRNPMNPKQVSRISLSQDVVDGIVFWTKNPTPMLDKLHLLKDYPFYFQFTLNAYGKDLEAGIPSKNDVIVPAFQNLSQQIGPEQIIWRYDPIILTPKYTTEYHIHYFQELAKRLSGHTRKCVISFVDLYRHLGKQFTSLGEREIYELAGLFSDIADKYDLKLETCAEAIDLSRFGIDRGHCIDSELLERIIGQPLSLSKDKNQREECGCMSSIDIGMYDSCLNGCKYCYANHSAATVHKNFILHNPSSPLLYGNIGPEDVVKERAMESCKIQQINLF